MRVEGEGGRRGREGERAVEEEERREGLRRTESDRKGAEEEGKVYLLLSLEVRSPSEGSGHLKVRRRKGREDSQKRRGGGRVKEKRNKGTERK